MEEDGALQDMLSQCGLLNFFEIPFMCSTKLLLDKMVIYWDGDFECFIIHGERLEITLLDFYHLINMI